MRLAFGRWDPWVPMRASCSMERRRCRCRRKPGDLLVLPRSRTGRARFQKTVLHDQVWPGLFVSDTNLAGLVAEIRRALGDDARTPRFVRTVQRFGYAFAGTVESGRGLFGDPERVGLRGDPERAARRGGCSLSARNAPDPPRRRREHSGTRRERRSAHLNKHSRRHARITVDGANVYLEELWEARTARSSRGVRLSAGKGWSTAMPSRSAASPASSACRIGRSLDAHRGRGAGRPVRPYDA